MQHALVVAVVSIGLARIAGRLGLLGLERSGDSEPNQRDAKRGVALVGGLSLFAAWALSAWQAGAAGQSLEPERALENWLDARLSSTGLRLELAGVSALVAALVLGLVDDRLCLKAGAKFASQCALGGILVWPTLAAQPTAPLAWAVCLAIVAAVVVSCNVINTYDNADGVVAGLAAPALWLSFPALAVGCLVLLAAQCMRPTMRALPRPLLGDSGAQLVAVTLLMTPAAWPCLALPALDLARVARDRVRRGSRPWIGDRTHLAQRIDRRLGLGQRGPLAVAAILTLANAPALALAWGLVPTSARTLAAGFGTTLVVFGLLVRWTRPLTR